MSESEEARKALATPGDTGADLAVAAQGVTAPERETPGTPPPDEAVDRRILREILSSSWLMTILAIVLALLVGAVLICATNAEVQRTAGYFFARPGDFFAALWTCVSDAYFAMFRGAIYDPMAKTVAAAFKPVTESLTLATPLILAGLGLAVAFRTGVFNIGAQGQVIIGATVAGFIGFHWQMPAAVQILLCVLGGILGGALWASIAGVLKAKTGAHEVIVTIMLNYVALFLLGFLLRQTIFQREGLAQPKSPPVNTMFWKLIPWEPSYRLHLGFLIALVCAVGVWFLLSRSTIGFEFRAVGENPRAARTAGISVSRAIIGVMAVAGAMAGLAGASQVLGTEAYLTHGIAGTLGFDSITVALLGRSKPAGVVGAGILFGALSAGGRVMQAATGTPIDIVLVLQSVVVLLIAAPPLVRAIFRLPAPLPKLKEAQA